MKERIITEKILLNSGDISKILKVSIPTAYKVIKELNNELEEMNKKENRTVKIIFRSKIYRKYFSERFYGEKFLKIMEIEKNFQIKNWEAQRISNEIKKELKDKGFKVIKGRIPEKYLLEKII